MKKTNKKILGLFALFLVVSITIFAAFLPGPETAATTSITDEVTVRVVGHVPHVEATGITPGSTIVEPEQNVVITHENITHLIVKVKYIDQDGIEHGPITVVDQSTSTEPGTLPLSFDFDSGDYGYGDYVITVIGEGPDGVTDEKNISFTLTPVTAQLTTDEETGEPIVDLNYDPDDGTPAGEGKVSKIEVNVYDEDGNLVESLSPLVVDTPTDKIELPFYEKDIPDGKYRIVIEVFDRNGEKLGETELTYDHKNIPVPSTGGDDSSSAGSPDTGVLFKNMKISQADFLTTGLIIFFIVGLAGAFFIMKRDKKATNKRRK